MKWFEANRLKRHRWHLQHSSPEWHWLKNEAFCLCEIFVTANGEEAIRYAWHNHLGKRVSQLYGCKTMATHNFGDFEDIHEITVPIGEQP